MMIENQRQGHLFEGFEKEMEFLYNSSENGLGIFVRRMAAEGHLQFICELANPQLGGILALDNPQLKILDRDYHQVFTEENSAILQVIDNAIAQKTWQEAIVSITNSGKTQIYKCVCHPFIEGGDVASLVLTLNYRMAQQPALYHPGTLVDALQDAVFIIDVMPDGEFRLNFLNSAYQESTGLLLVEQVGKTPVEILGMEAGSVVVLNYQRCLDADAPIMYEEHILVPNGNQWWQTKLVPIFIDGKPRQILGVSREITELKNREVEIQRLLDEYETIFNNTQTPMALWSVGEKGDIRLVRFNRISEEQNGMPTVEYAGKTLPEVFPGRTSSLIVKKNLECVREQKPVRFEVEVTTPLGTGLHVTTLAPLVRDGITVGIVASSEDVTQDRKREYALDALYREYEQIYNTTQTPMAIWSVEDDQSIRLVMFNRAAGLVDGLTTDENVGRSLLEIFPEPHGTILHEQFLTCIREHRSVSFESEFIVPKTGLGIHLTMLDPVIERGAVFKIIASSIDVTEERKRMDEINRLYEEYEGIFNTALTPMGIFSVDEDNTVRLIRFNPAYEDGVGFTTAKYQNCSLYEILEESYATRIDRYFQQCIRTQSSVVYSMEIQVKTKLGYFVTQLAPIIENGQVVKIIGSSADITDLKRYQDELQLERAQLIERVNERTEELRKAMRVKEDFLSTVSTNLRTPLTAILGFSELLRRIMDEDLTLFRYIDLVHDNAHLLSTMVDDMLSIATLENDQAELGYQFVNLEKFCGDCVAEVHRKGDENKVDIRYQYMNQQHMFWIDAPRIRQLLIQTLGMGINALPPESAIEVIVSFVEETDELHFHFVHHSHALTKNDTTPHTITDQMKLLLIDHLLELLHGRRTIFMSAEADTLLDIHVPLLPENHISDQTSIEDTQPSVG